MSELTIIHASHNNVRRHLLLTVSALAFFAISMPPANAEDVDRPTVWVELGGQLERMGGSQEPFLPPFTQAMLDASFPSPAIAERSPAYSFGGEGKISFAPKDSEWVLSASIRYGRANGKRHSHHETPGDPKNVYLSISGVRFPTPLLHSYAPPAVRFEDVTSEQAQAHAVLDFEVGKDVGLGTFGRSGVSEFGVGVRFAQLTSKSEFAVRGNPDFFLPTTLAIPLFRHLYSASSENQRSFHGIGPSVYWDASAVFAGNAEAGEISFDWGANAALLFGRQKVRENHKTFTLYNKQLQFPIYRYPPVTHHNTGSYERSRSVVVPNLGAFAGLSMRYSNAKISVGYRGDFFLGAMDGGLAARDAQTRSFYGPFATISIGFGD